MLSCQHFVLQIDCLFTEQSTATSFGLASALVYGLRVSLYLFEPTEPVQVVAWLSCPTGGVNTCAEMRRLQKQSTAMLRPWLSFGHIGNLELHPSLCKQHV